jgi:hypothetical protein
MIITTAIRIVAYVRVAYIKSDYVASHEGSIVVLVRSAMLYVYVSLWNAMGKCKLGSI